jgi:pteridine reductase
MQKVALITGGARRIGAAISSYLHARDFKIIIHCNKSLKNAHELCEKLNGIRANSSIVIQSSFNSFEDIENCIQNSFMWSKRLDVLVNNASIFSKDVDKFDDMWQINVKAPYIASNLAFPYLQKMNGTIVNITDSNIRKPLKDYAIYFQTKAALSMQTKALALEFAPDVRVNSIAPGAIIWPEGDNNLSLEKKQLIISKILLKKHGNPLNIAKAVFALIDNDFITGQEIFVDGGRNI